MKRDVLIEPFDQHIDIVIACDNSGAIGEKPDDVVSVSYDLAAYFAFRVAFMECVASGGVPFAVILQNFNGDAAWMSLVKGIQRGMKESEQKLWITGSTESNFSLNQSAQGVTVLGKKPRQPGQAIPEEDQELGVAVIGSPLVGEEVITEQNKIAPLHMFRWYCENKAVLAVVPVGSKGIIHELNQLFPEKSYHFSANVDLHKSAGPATCFIIVYEPLVTVEELKGDAENLFHKVCLTKIQK